MAEGGEKRILVKCGKCGNHYEHFIREGQIVFGQSAHGTNACVCAIDNKIRDPDVEKECPHDRYTPL